MNRPRDQPNQPAPEAGINKIIGQNHGICREKSSGMQKAVKALDKGTDP